MALEQQSSYLAVLEVRLQPLRRQLAGHPLYASIQSPKALRLFMQSHVFAVWDFMSLLKTLQRGLTSVDVPWLPSGNAEARRLINEIVLGEESDIYHGRAVSHFELYLAAMRACDADTGPVLGLLSAIQNGAAVEQALVTIDAPSPAQTFVRSTFNLIDQGQLHTIAAAFTFAREDLIPDMFRSFVRDLNRDMAGRLDVLTWYLERHIEVDGEEHGPMALRMVASLCEDDEKRWQEAADAAEAALLARLMLWDGIHAQILETQQSSKLVGINN